jgi:hypothetical protein
MGSYSVEGGKTLLQIRMNTVLLCVLVRLRG